MQDLVKELIALLSAHSMMLVTAESCTGGLIASEITKQAGVSAVFERGFVTYSNEAKYEELGVPKETLNQFGAVSPQTAEEMAEGALKNSHANISLSVTGIAGPDGGSDEKPVGLVYFGCAIKEHTPQIFEHHFDGNRQQIQSQAAEASLKHLINVLKDIKNA